MRSRVNTNYFSYSRAVPAQEQLIPKFKDFMNQRNVKSIYKQTNICNLGFVVSMSVKKMIITLL